MSSNGAQTRHGYMTGRRWLILLVVVAGIVVAGLIALNFLRGRDSLTRERLKEARQRWEAAGIRDYDLDITVGGGTTGNYEIQVRGGSPVGGSMNGVKNTDFQWMGYWSVPGLFDILETDLRRDEEPNSPRPHTEVEFDASDGHLTRYLRNVEGRTVHIQITLVRK